MQPIVCHAGYPMPLTAIRKTRILGFQATVETPGSASQVTIVDDENVKPDSNWCGNLLTSTEAIERNKQILEKKGIADVDATLESWLPEPITIMNGVSVYATNIEGGTLKVYRT